MHEDVLKEGMTLSFEDALEQLAESVKKLEGGDLPLEEALKLFEQGVALTRRCQTHLADAERRVDIVMKDMGSTVELAPFGQPS